MKLFIQEHLSLIGLQLLQLFMFGLLIWLGGFRDVPLLWYAFSLSFFFLFLYLLFKYISQRKLYRRLTEKVTTLDEVQQPLDDTPLSIALSELLKKQYHLYENKLIHLKREQEEQFIFMDRWIHQMKTPLSILELTAQELDEPVSSSMREEIDRMKNGLQTTLHMARLRSIDRDFHVKKVNVKQLITEVNQENKRLFIQYKVYPKVTIEDERLSAHTDEKWFYFILTQIVQNAVKYSAHKSNHITIRTYQYKKYIVIEIEDYGAGIPKADMARIFDPFFTGENGRHFRESTGVGLYLVKEVVTYLGHEIVIESEVGQGSTFRLLL